MALLQRLRDGQWSNLGACTLVGRYPHCDLQLLDRRVSGHHATLLFDGDAWWVRPQETTNGTFSDGMELTAGQRHRLALGAELQLGSTAETWHVADLGPPTLALLPVDRPAWPVPGDHWTTPDGRVELVREAAHWFRHDKTGRHRVEDGAVVEAEGEMWRVLLPANLRGGSSQTEATPATVRLVIKVSANGDQVHRCSLCLGTDRHELRVRRHTHLLVELADARSADPDGGWVDASVVQRRLGLSSSQLHLYTHRAQAQLGEAGFPDIRKAIEVRGQRGARQLRLGMGARIDTE